MTQRKSQRHRPLAEPVSTGGTAAFRIAFAHTYSHHQILSDVEKDFSRPTPRLSLALH